MNDKKHFFKSLVVYFLGNIMSRIIVFFMLPLYTTFISPRNYGYYDLIDSYVNFFSSVIFLEIGLATLRYMFDSSDFRHKIKVVYNTNLIYLISLIIYCIAFTVFSYTAAIEYFPLPLFYGIGISLQGYYGSVARGFGRDTLYAASGIVCTLVTVAVNIVLIVGLRQAYWSLYVAAFAGMVVQIIFLEMSLKTIPHFHMKLFDKHLIKQLYRFSLPMCLNSAVFWFLNSFNRVAVSHWLGESQNGYLAVSNKFAVILSLVGSCFSLAWQELAYQKEGAHQGSGEFYSKACNLYIKYLFLGITCLIPGIGVVFQFLINPSYHSAKYLVPLGILSTGLSLFAAFLGYIFGALKQNISVFITTVSGSIVNVITIYLLISHLGVQAANVAVCCGYSTICIIRVFSLNRKVGLKIDVKPILLYSVLFFAVSAVFYTQGMALNGITLVVVLILSLFLCKDIVTAGFNHIKSIRKNMRVA